MAERDYDRLHADEVADIAEFLRGLLDDAWSTQTLCSDFTVRDVVGHMISASEVRIWQLPARLVKAGFNPGKVSLKMARDSQANRSDEELIDALVHCDTRRGMARIFPTESYLLDRVVHHQDMRRPLGKERQIPAERLVATLDVAVSGNHGVKSNKRAKHLSLAATDVDWSHGDGPAVEGPGEAILMALCGRSAALDDLSGAGIDTLRSRMPSN